MSTCYYRASLPLCIDLRLAGVGCMGKLGAVGAGCCALLLLILWSSHSWSPLFAKNAYHGGVDRFLGKASGKRLCADCLLEKQEDVAIFGSSRTPKTYYHKREANPHPHPRPFSTDYSFRSFFE